MSTTLDRQVTSSHTLPASPEVSQPETQTPTTSHDASERLQATTTAVRLRIRWPGVRKTLTAEFQQQAADTFSADSKSLRVSKKLLDTSHPAFRAATSVKTVAVDYWKRQTLPYIEPGVRLLRREDLPAFEMQLTSIQQELDEAVEQLDRHYGELVQQARERLGHLFDPADYAPSLQPLFAIQWEYPSCDPPAYLLQVSPQLYHAECARVQQRFNEAVRLAEQTFAEELSQLVQHLAERLQTEPGETPKVFRDSAVTNLREFFDRFQRLNIRSDEQLDGLVAQARQVLASTSPQQLREQANLRSTVANELTRVEAALDGWLVDRPRRNIQRRAR